MPTLTVNVSRHTKEEATLEVEVENLEASEILKATQKAIQFHEDWSLDDTFDYEVTEALNGATVVLEYEDLPMNGPVADQFE